MAAEISQSSRTALAETHKEQDGEVQEGNTIWTGSIRRAKDLTTPQALLADHQLEAYTSGLRTAFLFEDYCMYTTYPSIIQTNDGFRLSLNSTVNLGRSQPINSIFVGSV